MRKLYLFLALLGAAPLFSQTLLTVPSTHLGIDSSRRILLVQLAEAALPTALNGLSTDEDTYRFVTSPATLEYTSDYSVTGQAGDTFHLYFTPLPLVRIDPVTYLNQREKRRASFTYAAGDAVVESTIGIRHRGGFSLRFPKKSFDLEFRESADREETRDVQFGSMREDDDWVIDALYNEPQRVNAYVAHKVWLDLHSLRYADEEPEARAGADLEFVEVFFDGQYYGLCTLGEQVDRKQLKLKNVKDGVVRGVLFKSGGYTEATRFQGVPSQDVKDDTWAGWEVKHPEPEEVDWDQLRSLIRFANTTDPDYFRAEAAARIDLENMVDYALFVNALRLTDNISKNVYLARYHAGSPYFFVPWDMDAGMGNKHDGTRIETPLGWSQNRLLARLIELSPAGFTDRLCSRLETLQSGLLDPEALIGRVIEATTYLERSGAYRREAIRWSNLNTSEEQSAYTSSVLRDQGTYLSEYVCSLSTSLRDAHGLASVPLRPYPNPTGDLAYVDLQGHSLPLAYRLLDRDGRILGTGQMTQTPAALDLRGLPGGMYVVQIGQRAVRVVKAD